MTDDSEEDQRAFFDRADSFINLANQHCDTVARGRVSASFMFALSRFNAWVCAMTCSSADELKGDREGAIEYFVKEYRSMLEQNLSDYTDHFDDYMRSEEKQ